MGKPECFAVYYVSEVTGGRNFMRLYRKEVVVGCEVVYCCLGGCLVYLALVYFSRSEVAKVLKLCKIVPESLDVVCGVGENVRPFSSSILSSFDR